MAENNLFQLAQVVTELKPMHHHERHHQQPTSPMPHSRSNESHHSPLLARKNACIVCAVCFTCSGYYGANCQCSEAQPRRGKNLPEGGLDSRAKKLSPLDRDDYEFTIKWLEEFAHSIYRDNREQTIIGLNDLTEVSLCKAHSSTLYRAKKRHQRNTNQAPPSPADSNGTLMEIDSTVRSSSVDSSTYPHLPQPIVNNHYYGNSQLAAKVREISFNSRLHNNDNNAPPESPDFSMMTASTSHKRKRINNNKPSSSASTPLLYTNSGHINSSTLNSHHHTNQHHHHIPNITSINNNNNNNNNSRQPTSSFSSQLPPLHLRTPSLSSLSSTLQHQLHVTPNSYSNSTNSSSRILPLHKVIETVSLKSSPKEDIEEESIYYVRNLAITDTYTFRDLLSEIDFESPPPPGKKIVISDLKRERVFPLGQAIRSVIRYPTETHIEFYLGLSEKASIDWNNYK